MTSPLPPNPASDRHLKAGTWAVLLIAAVLRVILVLKGGQYAFFDETRYLDSRAAAAELLQGHLLKGLVLPLEKGDHVGFKELGLIPALVEAKAGIHDWIPGLFFAAFSLAAIGLLGAIARRLSGSWRAQFWATLAGASSAALFYFSRHLFPYDPSLCVILAGWWLALRPRSSVATLLAAGALVGAGFIIYYGYWTLAGTILVVAVVTGPAGVALRTLARRALLLGIGFIAALLLPVAANHVWGSAAMVAGARALSGTITAGDFHGFSVPWEYLWASDHLELLLVLAFTASVLVPGLCRRRIREAGTWLIPEVTSAACVLALWGLFIVTGEVLHKFAVHDRLIRQLLPFLIVGFALGVDNVLTRANATIRRWLPPALALLLIANAAFSFATPLAQIFPPDFEQQGEALIAAGHYPYSADSYYRFVNVTQYIFAPEVLRVDPLETLLAAPHIYQYRPYLYNAKDRAERQLREAVDHRMRLVKMPVLPASRIVGDPYGAVTLTVTLPQGRAGAVEPLLTLGNRQEGDICYVRYLSDTSLTLGFLSMGQAVYETPPLDAAAGSSHEITLACGDLLPAGRGPAAEAARKHLALALDGATVMETAFIPKAVPPEQVHAGVRSTFQNFTNDQFSGTISRVSRRLPSPAAADPASLALPPGPARIHLTLLTGRIPLGVAEPIAVEGVAGRAVFLYVKRVAGDRVILGCEFWGVGAWESEPVPSNPAGRNELDCDIGPFFPAADAPQWGRMTANYRELLRQSVLLRWNGTKALYHATPAYVLPRDPLVFGRNPAGGSTVAAQFYGIVLAAKAIPLTTQDDPDRTEPPAE